MTKSPRAVARVALALARGTHPACSVATSRKGFTRHPLFAVLALKAFFRTEVPHYSPRCYAANRLLERRASSSPWPVGATAAATDRGLIGPKPTAAVDATGLDSRHTSRYFARRSGAEHATRTELTVACDTATHFLAGATVTTGPANDSPQFRPVLTQAALLVPWDRVLADAAFDSEAHHAYPREKLGIRSSVIPINARGHAGPPGGTYRRQMARRLAPRPDGSRSKRVYGQRWAVEKNQADYPSSRGWVGTRRIGYHRRDGVARAGRVVPATPGRPHRRSRMPDTTRRPAPPRA